MMENVTQFIIEPKGQINQEYVFTFKAGELEKMTLEEISREITKRFHKDWPTVYTFTAESLFRKFDECEFDLKRGVCKLRNKDDDSLVVMFISHEINNCIKCNEYVSDIHVNFDRNIVFQDYKAIGFFENPLEAAGLERRVIFVHDDAHAEHLRDIFTSEPYEYLYTPNIGNRNSKMFEKDIDEIIDRMNRILEEKDSE